MPMSCPVWTTEEAFFHFCWVNLYIFLCYVVFFLTRQEKKVAVARHIFFYKIHEDLRSATCLLRVFAFCRPVKEREKSCFVKVDFFSRDKKCLLQNNKLIIRDDSFHLIKLKVFALCIIFMPFYAHRLRDAAAFVKKW